MSTLATDTLYAGSNSLSVDELNLYHAINDLRIANGLSSLKPSYDMTVIAGQHAADFDTNVGYENWAAASVEERSVPTLHHWSDGQSFVGGILSLATGLSLSLPQSVAENADGLLAGYSHSDVMSDWVNNPGTSANLLSASWDTIGVGISGDMVYVTFGKYGDTIETTDVVSIVGSAASETIRTTDWADDIRGEGGNDVFTSLTNGDSIDGGTGLDRITLSGNYADYAISRVEEDGATWTLIQGAEGDIRISSVEYVEFADRLIDSSAWGENLTGVHFDADYYASTNPDVAAAVASGAFDSVETHYWLYGAAEGRDPAAFFDTGYYLEHNPDIAEALANGTISSAFEHYLLYGQFEGRDPNAYFDSDAYLANNPDVAAAIQNGQVASAIDHYLTFGRYEGRLATDSFDETYYLEHNPDVAAAVAAGSFASGLAHYTLLGQLEGRDPFDAGTLA